MEKGHPNSCMFVQHALHVCHLNAFTMLGVHCTSEFKHYPLCILRRSLGVVTYVANMYRKIFICPNVVILVYEVKMCNHTATGQQQMFKVIKIIWKHKRVPYSDYHFRMNELENFHINRRGNSFTCSVPLYVCLLLSFPSQCVALTYRKIPNKCLLKIWK